LSTWRSNPTDSVKEKATNEFSGKQASFLRHLLQSPVRNDQQLLLIKHQHRVPMSQGLKGSFDLKDSSAFQIPLTTRDSLDIRGAYPSEDSGLHIEDTPLHYTCVHVTTTENVLAEEELSGDELYYGNKRNSQSNETKQE
jgi:hypothetical protein